MNAQDPYEPRSLLQYDEILRGFPTSPNGRAARETYMREHGVVYVDGILHWKKDVETSTDSE